MKFFAKGDGRCLDCQSAALYLRTYKESRRGWYDLLNRDHVGKDTPGALTLRESATDRCEVQQLGFSSDREMTEVVSPNPSIESE